MGPNACKPRTARKYMVVKTFVRFIPSESNFEIVEEKIVKLGPREFIVKAEYISVDPYLRMYAKSYHVPYEQFSFQVGKVLESRNESFPVNSIVVSHSGWRDYTVLDGSPDQVLGIHPYIPDIGHLPSSLALGALGMSGLCAYLGLTEICKPKPGETLCVTSAGGAVGSLVGQIGKVLGCKVIGYTGSDAKIKVLKKELGFHHVFNYKTDDISQTLKVAAPNGIDCFFDNIGAPVSWAIYERMNEYGRIANCGTISMHVQGLNPKLRPKLPVTVRIEAFSFTQWDKTKQDHALRQIRLWLVKGTIKAKETIAKGFEELPNHFFAMLRGDTIGKAAVKV